MESNTDILLIQQYLKGELSPRQMHELEKQALDDPFLSDALEGYAHAPNPVSHLSILQRQLEERIAAQQEEKSVFNFTWQRLSIAAAAGLMFISAGILFLMNTPKEQKLTGNTKKVDVELSPVPGKDKTNVALAETLAIKQKEEKLALLSQRKTQPINRSIVQSTQDDQTDKVIIETNNNSSEARLAEVAILAQQPAAKGTTTTSSLSTVYMSKEEPKPTGVVVSKSDGSALPGAIVKVSGTDFQTTTNANGEFRLPDSLKGTIIASSLGYQEKRVKVRPGDNTLIALDESTQSLNEVVVTSAGKRLSKRAPDNRPVPQDGWQKYNEYIQTSAAKFKPTFPDSGTVIVSFNVDRRGVPQDLKIVKSVSQANDAEAIRIVKEGPKWMPGPSGKTYSARVEVTFGATR